MSVFIIAEMSCNHMGELDKALELIEQAHWAGADAVKISLDDPDGGITINHKSDDFMIKEGAFRGKYLYDLYRETHTPWDWVPELMDKADSLGIELFATVSCEKGVNFCEHLGMPRYKVSSFEACDIPLIRAIKKTGKPVIVSCGLDWDDAWDELQGYDASFLYCVSKYPASVDDFDLGACSELDGISDHTLEDWVVWGAVANGAQIVERHIMLGNRYAPDYLWSDTARGFEVMTRGIRSLESAMLPKQFVAPDRQLCKSLYAVEDIAKGEKFTRTNMRSIRPGNGLHPREYFRVLGSIAKQDIKRGTPIVEAML